MDGSQQWASCSQESRQRHGSGPCPAAKAEGREGSRPRQGAPARAQLQLWGRAGLGRAGHQPLRHTLGPCSPSLPPATSPRAGSSVSTPSAHIWPGPTTARVLTVAVQGLLGVSPGPKAPEQHWLGVTECAGPADMWHCWVTAREARQAPLDSASEPSSHPEIPHQPAPSILGKIQQRKSPFLPPFLFSLLLIRFFHMERTCTDSFQQIRIGRSWELYKRSVLSPASEPLHMLFPALSLSPPLAWRPRPQGESPSKDEAGGADAQRPLPRPWDGAALPHVGCAGSRRAGCRLGRLRASLLQAGPGVASRASCPGSPWSVGLKWGQSPPHSLVLLLAPLNLTSHSAPCAPSTRQWDTQMPKEKAISTVPAAPD